MKEPDQKTISQVMAALGRRNRGRKKAMTPAEREQRRKAGLASAKARGFSPKLTPRTTKNTPPPAPAAAVPLAQSERTGTK